MRALPRAVAAWSQELAALSDEGSELFGAWLPALERLRGALTSARASGEGEPQGLGGLGRRGPYERLLMSEWVLLGEAPDEFVRRAGAGEHLFHEIQQAVSVGVGRVVVLFDAGPFQLGAPRLAHLAWLMVLARDARRRGLAFGWGVLQAPDQALRTGTEQADVRALLAARTFSPPGTDMLEAWAGLLGSALPDEERWIVTGSLDPSATHRLGASTLAVVEEDAPEPADEVAAQERGEQQTRARGPRLGVTAHVHLHPSRRVLLPLPATALCGRLLRDPFRAETRSLGPGRKAGPALAPGAQVVFSSTSPHVLVRLESGQIVALSWTHTPTPTLSTFTPAENANVVAAGWRKGRMYVLTDESLLSLHTSHGGRWRPPQRVGFPSPGPFPVASPQRLNGLAVDTDAWRLYFADMSWRLYAVDLGRTAATLEAEDVIAWGPGGPGGSARGVSFVQRTAEGQVLRSLSERDKGAVSLQANLPRSSAGFVAPGPHSLQELVALEAGDDQWLLCHPKTGSKDRRRMPAGAPVYGAAMVHDVACLLVHSSSLDELMFLSADGRTMWSVRFPGEVEHACMHANGHWIAAQINGGVCVVDRKGTELLRWGALSS